MKVFISWSGARSNRVALAFKEWLPSVIQVLEPYVSSEDIDKRARWSSDIAKELEDSRFGILCVTRDNLNAPWLAFEAGALSKAMDRSPVIPFLLDVKRSEVDGPILQFQSAVFERDDIEKLMRSLNNACEEGGLDEHMFESAFKVWYPTLEGKLADALGSDAGEDVGREAGDEVTELLEEILELSRTNQLLLRNSDGDLADDMTAIKNCINRDEVQCMMLARLVSTDGHGEGELAGVFYVTSDKVYGLTEKEVDLMVTVSTMVSEVIREKLDTPIEAKDYDRLIEYVQLMTDGGTSKMRGEKDARARKKKRKRR